MWWGLAIEAPDPSALASFYSAITDWPVVHQEPGTAILGCAASATFLVFQEAPDYTAPTWPPTAGSQRPMMHLDFQVGDLDWAVEEAIALGATLADDQPNETVRVMFDPAGHPFCLCRDD
jgi:hypothetical protein